MPLPPPIARSVFAACIVGVLLCALSSYAWCNNPAILNKVLVVPDRGGVSLSIKGNPSQVSAEVLTNPNRLVIDFNDTAISKTPHKIQASEWGLKEIRLGINKSATRVVLDFGDNPVPTHRLRKLGQGLFVEIGTAKHEETAGNQTEVSAANAYKIG